MHLLLSQHGSCMCSRSWLATQLGVRFQEFMTGCQASWRRLEVYIDHLQEIDVPPPWPWVWTAPREASIAVRNHTKVHLRVELHAARTGRLFPRVDAPLLRTLWRRCAPGPRKEQALVVSHAAPGDNAHIEPELRTLEGKHFQLRLLTEAGVIVCSKRVRRGQLLDFDIPVPYKRNSLLKVVKHPSRLEGRRCSDKAESVMSADASTAAPSSAVGAWAGSVFFAETVGNDEEIKDATYMLETAVCPQCLDNMVLRLNQPENMAYTAGVRCDRCETTLVANKAKDASKPKRQHGVAVCNADAELIAQESKIEPFLHCSSCHYDLCQECALQEMREVWWAEPRQEPIGEEG